MQPRILASLAGASFSAKCARRMVDPARESRGGRAGTTSHTHSTAAQTGQTRSGVSSPSPVPPSPPVQVGPPASPISPSSTCIASRAASRVCWATYASAASLDANASAKLSSPCCDARSARLATSDSSVYTPLTSRPDVKKPKNGLVVPSA
eukprot:7110812-Prymnesium_polylepis.1